MEPHGHPSTEFTLSEAEVLGTLPQALSETLSEAEGSEAEGRLPKGARGTLT